MKYRVEVEGRRFEIEVRPDGTVWVDGRPVSADLEGLEGPFLSLLLDGRSYEAAVEGETGEAYRVTVAGRAYRTAVEAPRATPAETGACPAPAGSCEVRAPLPGLLVELCVAEGQPVRAGDVVAVLESMKMHMELRAPRDGVVQSLCAVPGREVGQGEVLAVIG
ncbi:MAG: biotin/lipoyl-binding protein [Thermoflexales bacterium]|nr:biotin/lipoyl-binding protein [Thermoflexales bacterium]